MSASLDLEAAQILSSPSSSGQSASRSATNSQLAPGLNDWYPSPTMATLLDGIHDHIRDGPVFQMTISALSSLSTLLSILWTIRVM